MYIYVIYNGLSGPRQTNIFGKPFRAESPSKQPPTKPYYNVYVYVYYIFIHILFYIYKLLPHDIIMLLYIYVLNAVIGVASAFQSGLEQVWRGGWLDTQYNIMLILVDFTSNTTR